MYSYSIMPAMYVNRVFSVVKIIHQFGFHVVIVVVFDLSFVPFFFLLEVKKTKKKQENAKLI